MDYQGLTIQFNGDASGLLATLRQIDGVTTKTQRSLSQVTKALKLDPSNAALYASQGKLIRRSLGEEEDELKRLRTAYGDYSAKLRQAEGDRSRYEREISRTTSLYDDNKRKLEENKTALESTKSSLEEYSRKYEETQAEWKRVSSERARIWETTEQHHRQENELLDERQAILRKTGAVDKFASTFGDERVRGQLSGLTSELEHNNDALEQNKTNLAVDGVQLNRVNREQGKLAKQLGTNSGQVKKLSEENENLANRQQTLTSESGRLTKSLNRLKAAQKDNAEEVKKYKAEIDTAKDQIEVYKAKIQSLREEMTRLDLSEWLNTTSGGKLVRDLETGGTMLSGLGDNLIRLGTRVTATEAALGGMFARSVISEAEEYGNAISQVGGYLDLTGQKLQDMSDLALYWGKETQFSATEAADAMSELAKGGMTDAQIKGGALEATMQLAAAGGISMADAATVAVNAIKVFGLSSEDATDVADALAGAANKSTAEIGGLASAFRYVSGWSGLADYSINDVAGALGLLADHGLQAEMAGTGLRNFMQRLGAPTGKAKELLEQYGVEVYDTSGKMKGLTELVDELNEAFGDLDDETRNETLNTIFGARALPAAIALMTAGREELEEYIGATEKEGYALEMMQARMGDLGWALEYLRGEFETFKVNIGKALEPIIINVANALEKMLSTFNSWDPSKQREFVLNMLKVAAAGPGLLVLGGALKAVGGTMIVISRVASAVKMLQLALGNGLALAPALGASFKALSGGALAAGGAIAGVAGGIAAVVAVIGAVSFGKYIYDQKRAQERSERFEHATRGLVETLDDIKTGDAVDDLKVFSDSLRTTTGEIDDMVESTATLVDTISERNADAQARIDELERARRIIQEYGDGSELTAQQLGDLKWALGLVNSEFGTSYQYNSDLRTIYDEQGESIDNLLGKLDELIRKREKEVQAQAIEDNMRETYQELSKWQAKLDDLHERYRSADSRRAAAQRQVDDYDARRRNGELISEQDYEAAVARLSAAEQEVDGLREDIVTANEEVLRCQQALEGWSKQLAEVLDEDLTDGEKLSRVLSILSETGDEMGDGINEFLQSLIDMNTEDAINNFDDLGKALEDAGFNMSSLKDMTQDELMSMLEDSTSVQDFIDKMVEWSNIHAVAEADTEGVEESKEQLDEAKEAADELDDTEAGVSLGVDLNAGADMLTWFSQWLSELFPNGEKEVDVNAVGNLVDGKARDELGKYNRTRLSKKSGMAEISGNIWDFMRKILPGWKQAKLDPKNGSANVSGNLHQSTNDLKEWNRLGMDSKWGKATIALAIQSKGIKQRDGGINYYRHADGYITNHSIYSTGHLIGEAGIEAVLPLNNRAATRPLTDTIADGVARRVAGATQYNLYINDARVNDDPAIRSAFLGLMTTLERKGAMNAGRR